MNEFQIGDVVWLKSSKNPSLAAASNTSQKFVVSAIAIGDNIKVTWFNYETRKFDEIALHKDLFVLAYRY